MLLHRVIAKHMDNKVLPKVDMCKISCIYIILSFFYLILHYNFANGYIFCIILYVYN